MYVCGICAEWVLFKSLSLACDYALMRADRNHGGMIDFG